MEASTVNIGNKFKMDKNQSLGQGAFGNVFKGTEILTGFNVAIKEININRLKAQFPGKDENLIKQEIITMRKCSEKGHQNLVRITDYFLEDNVIYLVMEYCNQGSLRSIMKNKKFTEEEAKKAACDISQGLSALHEDLGIIHRDLKPDNILCDNGVYKISDFGLSVEDDYFSTSLGTTLYIAPEYLDGKEKGKSVDIWAFGIILYELLFQKHPFQNESQGMMKIMQNIVNGVFEIPSTTTISPECKDLLLKCLEKDAKKRIKVKEVRSHSWFTSNSQKTQEITFAPGANTIEWGGGHYQGPLVNGKPHGKGIFKYSEGHIFQGDFVNGDFHGKGVIKWTNGDIFEGDYVNDKRTGKGVLKYSNGNIYEGDFLDGKRSGKGIFKWTSGNIFEGDFINDKRTGKGILKYSDGNIYEGDFVDGIKSGKGKFKWTNGDIFEGNLVDNNFNGKGVLKYSNGNIYEGDFVNDKKSGKGVFKWTDGTFYEGDFVDGNFHGKGVKKFADGRVQAGNWLNNNFQG